MIHEAISTSKVAKRYYQKLGRNYDNQAACKQFNQDNNIDKKLIREIMSEIFTEQKMLLNGKSN